MRLKDKVAIITGGSRGIGFATAAECMAARGTGVILSTSSMVSVYGQPSGFAYPASKFASGAAGRHRQCLCVSGV